jgi:hypothetical protein
MKRIREDETIGVIIHIYMEMSQGNALCSYPHLKQTKMSWVLFSLFFFSSTKLEHMRAEKVLPSGEGWHLWKGGGGGERG